MSGKQLAWISNSPSNQRRSGARRPLVPSHTYSPPPGSICWVSPGMAPVGQLSPLVHPALPVLFLSKLSVHGKQETPVFFPSSVRTRVNPPDTCFPLVFPPPRQSKVLNQEGENIISVRTHIYLPFKGNESYTYLFNRCFLRVTLGCYGVRPSRCSV